MSCPATGIKDFPIQNNVTITQTLNDSVFEPSTLEIQWGKRGTVPTFEQQNFLSEGVFQWGDQTTTLRLKSNLYRLKAVKLSEQLHQSFLLPEDKSLCIGEIVMIFESSTALIEKFVFLCIPILNKTTASLSPYLESIRQDRLPGRPIGLNELMSSDKKYTSYSTCLQQVKEGKTTAVQAFVAVFTGGLFYPQNNLREVLRKMKAFNNLTSPPPLGTLVEGVLPRTGNTLYLIANENDYKNFLRRSEIASSLDLSVDAGKRVDTTDSYKCVPLKPDENVKDNRIVIDTDKGIPLSQVLQEKQDEAGESKITPGMVERMIAAILGTAAGIFILSVLAYIFSLVTSENADTNFPWFIMKTKDMLPMVFVSMIVGIIGFLIGFFTSTT